MPDIRTYKVEHDWNSNCEVTLEVNHEILTPERALEINDFWEGAERRARKAHSNVFAVITLFGQHLINQILAEGGSSFGKGAEAGPIWSAQLRAEEGWGGEDSDKQPYGWCGIRVIAADVETVSFDDLRLKAVKS